MDVAPGLAANNAAAPWAINGHPLRGFMTGQTRRLRRRMGNSLPKIADATKVVGKSGNELLIVLRTGRNAGLRLGMMGNLSPMTVREGMKAEAWATN